MDLRGKASGFCIYNDSAVAIKYLQKHMGLVFYMSIQMHIMEMVCNGHFMMILMFVHYRFMKQVDIYFLVLGTLTERGHGKGYGYSFNIPVDAFTEDDSWLHCYTKAITEVAEFFKPDVIVTQNGADAHYLDPLTHLSVTMKALKKFQK